MRRNQRLGILLRRVVIRVVPPYQGEIPIQGGSENPGVFPAGYRCSIPLVKAGPPAQAQQHPGI
ncbi:hypothetical protein BLA13014_08247 [Burkholderia aenigmatica]|jgi:hypothetical protein|uniref:Uncharacterized protein n=1 Tax=Burkholderia aenigmatica TaxID=2015348 RepID=A0A6P2TD61_9BURK|nr:hypothetical protein BLA13014_08247 [Burkholderia aenigmatica]